MRIKKKTITVFNVLLILVILSHSCIESESNNIEQVIENQEASKDTVFKNQIQETENTNEQKVEVDFNEHKALLDIILILPDSAFVFWDWKLQDRLEWYNEIKENNYCLNKGADYLNPKYFEPTKARFSNVDGAWTISIYKTTGDAFTVITDSESNLPPEELSSGAVVFNFFEVEGGKIKECCKELSLNNFVENITLENMQEECNDALRYAWEYNYGYDNLLYDSPQKGKIEIRTNWHLPEENFKDCLHGNTILYTFNPQLKHFELEKIYWTPSFWDSE